MAGGEGTRLRPLTYNQPKPLMPMANKALMEHVVALLRRHGFTDIVVTVAFHASALQAYFGDGSEFGVRMLYANEEPPLGTAGSVRNAMRELGETFLVISGDVLTDIDLSALVSYHSKNHALATLALHSVPNPLEFGLVVTNEDGTIERFLEKPSWGEVFSDTINTGVYVLEPQIFSYIGPGVVDFSNDVFPRLLGTEKLYGFISDAYWEDIGALDAYARAHQDILDRRAIVEVPGFEVKPGIWLGEGAELSPEAEVKGPALIGDYCSIGPGAVVGEYSVLGRNVHVGQDARTERAIVHDNVYLDRGVQLRGCIVGRSSDLRRGSRVEEGAIVGDDCFVGENAVVRPGVRVFPFKTVEQGAIVNSSIVWESRGARNLFGRNGVCGLANVDVSPELAQRLAMAFATTMPKGASVTVARDTSRAARILAQSLVVGFNAAGVNVADLEVTTMPVTRFGLRHEQGRGGADVRLSPEDAQSVSVRFLGPDGLDISEANQRKLERLFYREDFRRCLAPEIGGVQYTWRTKDYYSQALLEQVGTEAIRAARFKVVLDYAYGGTTFVMPSLLGKLGADVLALNPYSASDHLVDFDRWEHARAVSALVRSAGAHFGAVLSPDGERLTLVDDRGRALSDNECLLALLTLVLGSGASYEDVPCERRGTAPLDLGEGPARSSKAGTQPGRRGQGGGGPSIALTVSAPAAAEEMCRRAGARLVWTKLSAPHLMQIASTPGVVFAAGTDGGYIFPEFMPALDGVAALVHTFGLLAGCGGRLSHIVDRLPQVWTAHERVVTPWEKKGVVMRSVMALCKGRPTVLIDGVKVLHDDGWCLIVPDPEEPVTHVWAEAATEAAAQERASEYAARARIVLGS